MTSEWRRIRGILDELINNAFEAGAKSVRSDIEDEGDRFTIRVRDDGRGMSPETLDRANKSLSEPRRRE
ncbi:MAG: ATP-binding protein, partial [Clostridia bacterium]